VKIDLRETKRLEDFEKQILLKHLFLKFIIKIPMRSMNCENRFAGIKEIGGF
jgi:hypothetical protein